MNRFLTRVAGFVLLQFMIALVVLRFGAPKDSQHYLSAIHDKLALLHETSEQRVIMVGGSSVAFGFQSKIVGDATQRRPVNLGLHAGLGLEFILRVAEEQLRPGDVVIIAPEYDLLTSAAIDGQSDVISSMLWQWPNANRYFGRTDELSWKAFADRQGLEVAHQWVRRARRRLSGRDLHPPIYRRSGFDERGDMVAHWGQFPDKAMQGEVLEAVSEDILSRAIARLNEFAERCEHRGARPFFTYAPLPTEKFAASRNVIARLRAELESSLEMPILETPEDVCFHPDSFFDSSYHLTRDASRQRSEMVVRAIQPYLRQTAARTGSRGT